MSRSEPSSGFFSLIPVYAKPSLPAPLSPLTPALLANVYLHSKDEDVPFRCDFIEKLVLLILAKNPSFFGGLL